MDFACMPECSDCCVRREYFPDVRFGKIGVLILPHEQEHIKRKASELGIKTTMLPRVGVSGYGADGPHRVVAYQLMGRDADGDTCPFLDTSGRLQSPHGGHGCRIYDQRPLACSAYPLMRLASGPPILDPKCRFCKECPGGAAGGLESEERALLQIERSTACDEPVVWRFATATGDESDRGRFLEPGWVRT